MNVFASRTRDLRVAILFVLALTCFNMRALASGDGGCTAVWKLEHRTYEGCSNMAFLSPSNDTRVNLLLMMADLKSAQSNLQKAHATARLDAPLFLWEDLVDRFGTPADSAMLRNTRFEAQSGSTASPATPSSDDPFIAAVLADSTLEPEERDALVTTRRSGHSADGARSVAEKMKTASAKAYAGYLEGAAKFWQSDYATAATDFESLTSAESAWVRETASYMIGRAHINQAQIGAFDEWGSFNKNWHADPNTVAAAEAAFDKYLQQYPKGVYAQSARGLKRRGYWLAGDVGKLEREYGALMLLPAERRNISDVELAQEIDNKVVSPPDAYGAQPEAAAEDTLLKNTENPILLAMLDLEAMRSTGLISLSALQQQKPYFAGQIPLYEYLLAVHALYIQKNPAEVLRMIPDSARQSSFTYVQFSRQILRGMALEALKDHNALGFWMQMLPGAQAAYQRPVLELAIAYHEERAGEIRKVFAPDSPVHFPYLREVLLTVVADADLLRSLAKNTNSPQREREIALFTLLYKEATRGAPADFLKDVAMVPANAPSDGFFMLDNGAFDYFAREEYHPPDVPLGVFLHDKTNTAFGCPGLRATEAMLVQDMNNPTAQLCLADFVRLNPTINYVDGLPPSVDELGGTASLFPGRKFERMNTYSAVLTNPKSTRNDKAYALFRSVNCFAPSGINDCGGKDEPVSQRKAWFTTLKHDYTDTRWANALQYYW